MLKFCAARALLVLLLLSPFAAYAQDPPSLSLDIIGIDSTDLSEVAIHASILDAAGQLVSGLEAANFSIGGDLAGRARVTQVANVTDDDLAFASVLVMDTSSSMAGKPLIEAQAAARSYLAALGPDDPVALVAFNTDVRQISGYTTDRGALLNQIDNLAYGGQTALYDATYRAIEIANEAPLPRVAVVILSDGGEYGNASRTSRDESIRAATIHGVPVYSIGLGWDIDRRFLAAIAAESNAAFYEAPEAGELGGIYSELAFLFRSQYILTMGVDVPADGTRYDFSLIVTTADGRSASGSATLRAPIPIPLLFLPDDLFSEAITEDTQITVEIRADQDIESIEYALDGEVVSTDASYTLAPEEQSPGEHQLDITVSDVEGDVGTLSAEFEVAALPPRVSDDFDAAPSEDVAEAEVISVDAGGQTEITLVEFLVDGEVVATDSEAPYEFDLDPFEFRPEAHTLSIRATNAGGQTTTVDKTFEVEALPPRLEIEGIGEDTLVSSTLSASIRAAGQSPIVSLSVEPELGALVEGDRLDFTLSAADLKPGRNRLAVRAVDAAGAETVETIEFDVAALAPDVAIAGIATDAVVSGPREVEVAAGGQTEITRMEVRYDDGPARTVEGGAFTIPAEELGDGAHEAQLSVTNAGGQTTTVSLPFTVQLPPTPTFTPLPTDTATATATATPEPTATATDTAAPKATSSATPAATNTLPASATAEASATVREQALVPPTSTDTPLPPTSTDTPLPPSETDTPIPPTSTNTPLPPTSTDTPLPPSETNTPLPPTSTDTPLPPTSTDTPLPPTSTDTPLPPSETNTPLPPTSTDTPLPPTSTDTPLPPTSTDTPLPPTSTDTPLPPTSTDTPIPPTSTDTPLPPTSTDTPIPPTSTDTPLPPTSTDTPVPTSTDTPVPTDTDTPVPTSTDTPVPTDTDTPVPTSTDTPVPTSTDTPVPTSTATPVPTDTDTPVPTSTDTPVPTDTDTPVPTSTDTPVPTSTDTPVPTSTDTPVPTDTDTPVPTDTDTPVPTSTNTPVPTDTDTPVPTDTDTPVPTDTDTPVPTSTDTPVPTSTDTPVPTDTDTPVPTDTDTPVPTSTDTPIPTDTDTPVPTSTDTPVPTDTETPVPTSTDTPIPTDTDTPVPTDTPTPTNTAMPTATATATEAEQAAVSGEASPAGETATVAPSPTEAATEQPTLAATVTDAPTSEAISEPTAQPTLTPVTITEIDDPSADEPETSDTSLAIGAVALGLLLLLALFLIARRRGSRATPAS